MRTIDDNYPAYIREHQEELSHLIMKEESEEDRIKRQRKRRIRKIKEKGIRAMKKIGRMLLGKK